MRNVMSNQSKSNPIAGPDRPRGFQEVEAPRFQDSRHMKVVRLSALRTGRLYPAENIPGTHFCQRLIQPQGHSASRRIMSTKNSSDTMGNRTRDLPVHIAVPQPTAPPRTPNIMRMLHKTYATTDSQVFFESINCYVHTRALSSSSCAFTFSTLRSSRACLLAHVMDACLNLSSLVHQQLFNL